MSEDVHRPNQVLITGGAGFIGSNLVHWLLARDKGVRIVNLDALTYAGRLVNLEGLPDPERHTFVHGDIRDGALVADLLRQFRIDTVIHLAAESHVDRSLSGPTAFVETNVLGTHTLLDACRQAWLVENACGDRSVRFHHVSTDEVYGSLGPDDPAFTETTPYAPSSPYSASKAGSDHLVRAYGHSWRLPCTISNCSNNYGPRQHDEKFIPTVIRSCEAERAIPVYGNGLNVRDWLFVDDHCEAIDTIVRKAPDGETYNVGGASERSNLEVVRAICSVMDTLRPERAPHSRLVSFVADRPGHDWRYAVDISKIERTLGWRPRHRFEDNLTALLRSRAGNSSVS
jgi:dTDP-glucose 4,6-dehydratase